MGMVYHVKFWNIEKEETGDFHIIEGNFWSAVECTCNYLDDEIGEDAYEVLMIKAKPQLNVVNYMNDEEQPLYEGLGDCPYCSAQDCDPLLVMDFNCACGYNIVVSDSGWTALYCKNCGKRMERKDFKIVNGKYIYIESKKEEQ
jgi:hypothetical protein